MYIYIYNCEPSPFFLYLLKSEANMAYSQLQKVETSLHMASAGQFYDVFCNKPHTIASISPENIQSVEVHKSELGPEGSIVSWNYLHGMVWKL